VQSTSWGPPLRVTLYAWRPLANASDLLTPVVLTIAHGSIFNVNGSSKLVYGPIFRRVWTNVHHITSSDAGETVVCIAVFRLSMSCSIPEIFAIEVRSRPKSRRKSQFDRECLRNGTRYRQPENGIANCDLSRVCWHNLVNFGPQTAKNRTVVWRLLFFIPPNVGAFKPLWGCVSKTWSFSNVCENLR